MPHARTLLAAALLTLVSAPFALTQDKPAPEKSEKVPDRSKPVSDYHDQVREWETRLHTTDCRDMPNRTIETDCMMAHAQTRTIQLHNVTGQNDANEILVAARNMFDPSIKIFLLAGQNAISVTTYPQELDRIEAYLHSMDRARKTFRLTFTLVDSDSGKRVGVQHFAVVALDGQRATMKQGSKVPVVTGSFSTSDKTSQEQMTYLDVGMNFDVTPTSYGGGLVVKLKIEQSSVADSKSTFGDRDPIVRQSVYEGVSAIPLNKPATITSLDVPNTTRHLDVEVLAEPVL